MPRCANLLLYLFFAKMEVIRRKSGKFNEE
jgi:hypothetical protein